VNETLLAVAGGLMAAVGAVLAWRQRRATGTADTIRLVSTRALGGKGFLTIVEVDGERLLLGVTGERVALVTKLGAARGDAPAEDAERA
jgi:flagellar biogenesis protein FliO